MRVLHFGSPARDAMARRSREGVGLTLNVNTTAGCMEGSLGSMEAS